MLNPADALLSSYGFELPPERIAQRPVEPRHSARLLVVDPPGEGPAPHARHLRVWDLQQELQSGDLLVVNDTRVLRARLEGRRVSGGAVELLVLEPWQPAATARDGIAAAPGRWLCLAKPAKRLKPGDIITVHADAQEPLPLTVLGADPETGGRIVQFPLDCIDAAALEPLL
ncbi:MAG: S-adenosylmethionine:tRNA ribosyltransferase-isomerase, partial [Prochlorococcaceae cyanobacterium]